MKAISKMSKGVKASIALFLSSVLIKGISYITTPIFTRLLTAEEYGKVSIYFTWAQVFGLIAMFCLSYGVFNNGMIDYPDKRDEYAFSMLVLSNIITACFSALLLIAYPVIRLFINLPYPLLILMCLSFFLMPAYNFWITRQRFEYKYKALTIVSISSAVLSTTCALLFVLLNDDGQRLYPRLLGGEIVLFLFYIFFYVFLAVKAKGRINTKYWREALVFNLPLIPHYLSTYLLGSSDKIMISYLINDSATAYYSVAYAIASIALIIWTAMNASLLPYTYEKCKANRYSDINKITIPLLFLFAVGCIVVIMIAPEVIKVMATQEYVEAVYVIPPVVGGVFFQVQYYIYANIVYYYKKSKYVMIGSIVSVTVNIVLNYFCIKEWGYIAAGYTTLVCYLLQAIIDYFALKKVVKTDVYNMKFIALISLFVLIISLAGVFLYEYSIIRYALITLIVVLLLVFIKPIIKLFSSMIIKEKQITNNVNGEAKNG